MSAFGGGFRLTKSLDVLERPLGSSNNNMYGMLTVKAIKVNSFACLFQIARLVVAIKLNDESGIDHLF